MVKLGEATLTQDSQTITINNADLTLEDYSYFVLIVRGSASGPANLYVQLNAITAGYSYGGIDVDGGAVTGLSGASQAGGFLATSAALETADEPFFCVCDFGRSPTTGYLAGNSRFSNKNTQMQWIGWILKDAETTLTQVVVSLSANALRSGSIAELYGVLD